MRQTSTGPFAELEQFIDQRLKNFPFGVPLLDEVLAVGGQSLPDEVLRDIGALPQGARGMRCP